MKPDNFISHLSPLPTSEEIRKWDAKASEFGIEEFLLMENAGRAAMSILLKYQETIKDKKILIFMGSGNNGGDAACLARNLMDHGAQCYIFSFKRQNEFKGSAQKHLDLAIKNGALFFTFKNSTTKINKTTLIQFIVSATCSIPDIIIDGILGTGFSGSLNNEVLELIEGINFYSQNISSCFVLALDIPSGLDAQTGFPSPIAIRADVTTSFAAVKLGEVMSHARRWTGCIYQCNIGLPQKVLSENPAETWLLDGNAMRCLPDNGKNSYKNSYGHVVIIGGLAGFTGAAHLSARAALATGSGLVTVVSPSFSAERIKIGLPEIMIYKLGEARNTFWPDTVEESLIKQLQKADSIVIGPGFGRDKDSENFLRAFLKSEIKKPTVFDADALMILARNTAWLDHLTAEDILTPHPGEAGALLGIKSEYVQKDRIAALKKLCELSRASVVLKGANTMIGQTEQAQFVCPYDIPQLAIGGAGDVLAGCIGSLRGSRETSSWPSVQIAAAGVILHALAGLICSQKYPYRGLLSTTLAETIPFVKQHFIKNERNNKKIGNIVPWPQLY